jgi:hypothetical protein
MTSWAVPDLPRFRLLVGSRLARRAYCSTDSAPSQSGCAGLGGCPGSAALAARAARRTTGKKRTAGLYRATTLKERERGDSRVPGRRLHNPETIGKEVISGAGIVPDAARRSAVPGIVDQAPTAQHAGLSFGRVLRVHGCLRLVLFVPVTPSRYRTQAVGQESSADPD